MRKVCNSASLDAHVVGLDDQLLWNTHTGEHLGQLNFVLHCRTLRMTLAEIRTLQDLQTNPGLACNDINILLDQHIYRVRQQIDALHLLEKQPVVLRNRCRDNVTVGECGILKSIVSASARDECVGHEVAQVR